LWFRGFLFAGIGATPLGVPGAILLTAGLWAALHMQYDLYDMSSVFLLGLLFGTARYRTGSLWPSLSMHMFANLVATVETAAKLMR
jgi:membrane protease YdiL (CAAX protease family)